MEKNDKKPKWSVGKMFNEEVLMEDGVIKMSLTTEELVQMLNEREELKEANEKLRELLERTRDRMRWTIETHPERMEKADYEHLDEIKSLLKT